MRTPASPLLLPLLAHPTRCCGRGAGAWLPLLRIPARPWVGVSSFTGRGDGGLSSHPALLEGDGKCVSSPSSRPASGNAAQGSVTNLARQGGAVGALRGVR